MIKASMRHFYSLTNSLIYQIIETMILFIFEIISLCTILAKLIKHENRLQGHRKLECKIRTTILLASTQNENKVFSVIGRMKTFGKRD